MNVWRLMSHHKYPQEVAEWIRNTGTLAIGWGGTGDLSNQEFHTLWDLQQLVKRSHQQKTNHASGGRSLWRLYKGVQKGDLVIISAAGSRTSTMRVTGDYYYFWEGSMLYEHRRKAEAVPIDPNRLWSVAGGAAPNGGSIYSALIRCKNTLSDADFRTLVG